MSIDLCVDQHTGEPYLVCRVENNGCTDDQVMRRLEQLLLEGRELNMGSSGGNSEGEAWFALKFRKEP